MAITWREDGVPVSVRFDDPYYSIENGLNETRHVFLAGNDLPNRFCSGFHIAELGFGTGLNMLATLKMWRETGQSGHLKFTSFEAFPMSKKEMIRAQKMFSDIAPLAEEFMDHWQDGMTKVKFHDLEFTLVIGDVRSCLTHWHGMANAWYLDGFSPAKNPEMWGPDLMVQVEKHTALNGSVATYTAAGFVRRGLQEAGFDVERIAGFGRKRHMTIARKPMESYC